MEEVTPGRKRKRKKERINIENPRSVMAKRENIEVTLILGHNIFVYHIYCDEY